MASTSPLGGFSPSSSLGTPTPTMKTSLPKEIKILSLALAGDVTTEDNLEFLTALFWMAQNVGVTSALILSQLFKADAKAVYLISILVITLSLLILLPLLRLKIEKINEKISQEVA